VDIRVMLKELPKHTVATEVPHFEHLDFLWAQDVDKLVFPHVFDALKYYSGMDGLTGKRPNGAPKGLAGKRSEGFGQHQKSSSWSEDDLSSDYDGTSDLAIPKIISKSHAQIAREREYVGYIPSSPVLTWVERQRISNSPISSTIVAGQQNGELISDQEQTDDTEGGQPASNGSATGVGVTEPRSSDGGPISAPKVGLNGISPGASIPTLGDSIKADG